MFPCPILPTGLLSSNDEFTYVVDQKRNTLTRPLQFPLSIFTLANVHREPVVCGISIHAGIISLEAMIQLSSQAYIRFSTRLIDGSSQPLPCIPNLGTT